MPSLMGDTNQMNSKSVASFPPKSTMTPSLVLSSDISAMRSTPTPDDASSIIDDDLNFSADDELAAYDAERAKEYGERIIVLRKRIRQVENQFFFV